MVRKNDLIELALCELTDSLNDIRKSVECGSKRDIELHTARYGAQLMLLRMMGFISDIQHEALLMCVICSNWTVYDAFELNNVVIIGGAKHE